MKVCLSVVTLLFSVFAMATVQSGYVKNVIEDDEGLKVILSSKSQGATKLDVSTYYFPNTMAEFNKTRAALNNAKNLNLRMSITQNAGNAPILKVGP